MRGWLVVCSHCDGLQSCPHSALPLAQWLLWLAVAVNDPLRMSHIDNGWMYIGVAAAMGGCIAGAACSALCFCAERCRGACSRPVSTLRYLRLLFGLSPHGCKLAHFTVDVLHPELFISTFSCSRHAVPSLLIRSLVDRSESLRTRKPACVSLHVSPVTSCDQTSLLHYLC